jgi:hypothetical protein
MPNPCLGSKTVTEFSPETSVDFSGLYGVIRQKEEFITTALRSAYPRKYVISVCCFLVFFMSFLQWPDGTFYRAKYSE